MMNFCATKVIPKPSRNNIRVNVFNAMLPMAIHFTTAAMDTKNTSTAVVAAATSGTTFICEANALI
jgi:hypothetical protein